MSQESTGKVRRLAKSPPGRQVVCFSCGSLIFADDSPGVQIPPHCCLKCRASLWPTPAQEELRRKREEEWSDRQRECKEKALRMQERGEPTIKAPEIRLSKKELDRRRILDREEEIFSKPLDQLTRQEKEWLLKVDRFLHAKTPAGRPREERNEDWLAKIARAKVLGIKKPTLQELAGIQKPPKDAPLETRDAYVVDLLRLRDALEKAKKRRQLPVPSMS